MPYSNSFKKNTKKRQHTIKKGVKFGPLFLSLLSLFLIALCGFFYLSQSNQVATSGIEIKKLEKKLDELKEEQKKVQFQKAELESLKNIEEKARQLNMLPAEKMIYIAGAKDKKDMALSKNNQDLISP